MSRRSGTVYRGVVEGTPVKLISTPWSSYFSAYLDNGEPDHTYLGSVSRDSRWDIHKGDVYSWRGDAVHFQSGHLEVTSKRLKYVLSKLVHNLTEMNRLPEEERIRRKKRAWGLGETEDNPV